MTATLATNASDEEIIALIEQWVNLLEQEKYAEAYAFLDAEPLWSAELIRQVIEAYGDEADNRVTLLNNGTALDGAGNVEPAKQRKEVEWFDESRGEVWYDLNINGLGSDLTATFELEKRGERIHVVLQDIHVM